MAYTARYWGFCHVIRKWHSIILKLSPVLLENKALKFFQHIPEGFASQSLNWSFERHLIPTIMPSKTRQIKSYPLMRNVAVGWDLRLICTKQRNRECQWMIPSYGNLFRITRWMEIYHWQFFHLRRGTFPRMDDNSAKSAAAASRSHRPQSTLTHTHGYSEKGTYFF